MKGMKMNKQPVSYLQTDTRWENMPYRVPGETSTIGSAGCGPTCAAMLVETLTGNTFTPADACRWSVEHGYKALNQGTYYSYFKQQFAVFGIDCDMLNWTSTYGRPNHPNHEKALELLKQGYYLIALMNQGSWTSNGHFIVVWWADDKIRINDPNSTKDCRVNGDPYDFRSQVKYYWWIDARKYNNYNNYNMEDDTMTGKEIYDALQDYLAQLPAPDWAKAELQQAVDMRITDGKNPMQLATRYQAAIMAKRAIIFQRD